MVFHKMTDEGVVYVLKYIRGNEKQHTTVDAFIEELDKTMKSNRGTEATFFRSINDEDPRSSKVISFGRKGRKENYLYRELFTKKDRVRTNVITWYKQGIELTSSDDDESSEEEDNVTQGAEAREPQPSNNKKRAAPSEPKRARLISSFDGIDVPSFLMNQNDTQDHGESREELTSKLTELEARATHVKKELDLSTVELGKRDAELTQSTATITALKAQNTTQSAKILEQGGQITSLEAKVEELSGVVDEQIAISKAQIATKTEQGEQITGLNARLNDLNDLLGARNARVAELDTQLAASATTIAEREAQLTQSMAKVDSLQTQLTQSTTADLLQAQLAQSTATGGQSAITDLQEQLAESKATTADLQAQLAESKATIADIGNPMLKAGISGLISKLESLEDEVRTLAGENTNLKQFNKDNHSGETRDTLAYLISQTDGMTLKVMSAFLLFLTTY
jgi:DNA repair exonuclease SbcCD ATPase subunit